MNRQQIIKRKFTSRSLRTSLFIVGLSLRYTRNNFRLTVDGQRQRIPSVDYRSWWSEKRRTFTWLGVSNGGPRALYTYGVQGGGGGNNGNVSDGVEEGVSGSESRETIRFPAARTVQTVPCKTGGKSGRQTKESDLLGSTAISTFFDALLPLWKNFLS